MNSFSENDTGEWSETALDWFKRSHKAQNHNLEPFDPVSAGWSFVNGSTGIDFIDVALQNTNRGNDNKPALLELTGSNPTVTQWTLISLAARFVVATRQSKFPTRPTTCLPQVVLVDSLQSMTLSHLVTAVRQVLLLQQDIVSEELVIDQEVNDSLSRIHFIFVHDTTTTVAALEALRLGDHHGGGDGAVPMLMLWNGFLTTFHDTVSKMEVVRQVMRLWRETNVFLVVSSHHRYSGLEDKYITCRISLESNEAAEHKATVSNGTQVEFKIGTAGIVSHTSFNN